MKTLVMNNSMVMVIKAPVADELDAFLTEIIAGGRAAFALSSGTRLELVFETDPGAARFGFCSGDEFLLEALVLGTGQGRQSWADFRCWCQRLFSDGRAKGQHPPLALADDNSWNCVIIYNACLQLDDEDLGELVKLQGQLAEAYVRRLDHTAARKKAGGHGV